MPESAVAEREKVSAEVLTAEMTLLLEAFKDFKAVVKSRRMGGELRIALEVNRKTNEPEIIYVGDHFKRSLEPVRVVYKKQSGGENGGRK